MARDGSRGYEFNAAKFAAVAKAVRVARAEMQRRNANEPLLPNPPPAPASIVKHNEAIDMAVFTPTLDAYAETILRIADQAVITDATELPRILCRKSGVEIGRVSPSQYAIMRAIWPALTVSIAEDIISRCGLIAPQYIFTMPQAWQIMVASDPSATLTLALEIGLRLNWSATDKAERNSAWIETAADDQELIIIGFELVSDLMRINRDWIAIKAVEKFIPQLAHCHDIAELIELLKDCAHIVARETHAYMRDLSRIQTARMEELFERHGVRIMRQRKPIIGEADLARRLIGMYFKDFSYLTVRMSNAELLAIVGNVAKLEHNARLAHKNGKQYKHAGLERYRRQVEAHDAELAKMAFDDLISSITVEASEPVNVPVIPAKNIAAETAERLDRLEAWRLKRKNAAQSGQSS